MIARTDKATITRLRRNAEYCRSMYKQIGSPYLQRKWIAAVQSCNATIARLKEKYKGEQTEFDFSTIKPQL
jgi:hypothetical protein